MTLLLCPGRYVAIVRPREDVASAATVRTSRAPAVRKASDRQRRGDSVMPDDRLIAVKDRAAALFLQIPGVTAVGLGGRERGGQPTGEVVLKVFVARKRPAAELTPGQLLPEQFEGVGVDVSEMQEAELEGTPPPQPAPPPG